MSEDKRLFAVYKRGQGLWSRIGFAVVAALFLLWFVITLDASFSKEVILIEARYTVLDSSEGTLPLGEEHLQTLEKNGVAEITAAFQKKGEDKKIEELERKYGVRLDAVKKALSEGETAYLLENVEIDRPLSDDDVAIIRKYKTPDEKISVSVRGPQNPYGEKPVLLDGAVIEKELHAGNRVVLKSDVYRRTWWHARLITLPLVDVDINNGHIILVFLLAAGGLGIFRLVNNRRNTDFLIETESELKKVDWSAKEEVFGSTKVVLVLTVVFLALMFSLDIVYQWVVRRITEIFQVG